MKVMFCICSILLFCSFLLAVEAVQIPLGDIQEIASRQAEAYWGKVYSAEPIPYYDRKGDLVVWQFNFSLGKPFPGQEELQQRCRQFRFQALGRKLEQRRLCQSADGRQNRQTGNHLLQ